MKSKSQTKLDLNKVQQENMGKKITPIQASEIINKCLNGELVTNIWYGFGSLVFEFGAKSLTGFKGEYSVVCECDWKFQRKYKVLFHSNREKKEIKGFIKCMIGKRLKDCFILLESLEIYLNFEDIYFTTLSTFGSIIGWSFRVNNKGGKSYIARIICNEKGIYYKKANQQSNVS